MIGPSNLSEPRDKVAPYGKNYAWISVLWSFDKIEEVGVFSYLVISCLKAMTMVLGVVRPGRDTDFSSKKWNRCRGLSMDSPRTDVGLLKTVSICLLDRKCPCEFA